MYGGGGQQRSSGLLDDGTSPAKLADKGDREGLRHQAVLVTLASLVYNIRTSTDQQLRVLLFQCCNFDAEMDLRGCKFVIVAQKVGRLIYSIT